MQRTQRDTDIARMSALKSAIDLMGIFPDEFAQDDAKTTEQIAIQIAERFVDWITAAAVADGSPAAWEQGIITEIHSIQRKLNLTPTNFSQPGPSGPWTAESRSFLLEQLRAALKENGNGGNGRNGRSRGNGKPKRSPYIGAQDPSDFPQGETPISNKQLGYLCHLHQKAGLKYDRDELTSLTSREASARIDDLLASAS